MLASLTEAIAAGTLLSLGRGDIIGDTHATPDEFAWHGCRLHQPQVDRVQAAPGFDSNPPCGVSPYGATVVMELLAGLPPSRRAWTF
jgi:DHA2 family multidrug resistance protein